MTSQQILIAELKGRLSRIEDFLCKTMGEKESIETNMHALVAENAALREDKSRLDWLEENKDKFCEIESGNVFPDGRWRIWRNGDDANGSVMGRESTLRDTIDAARKGNQR